MRRSILIAVCGAVALASAPPGAAAAAAGGRMPAIKLLSCSPDEHSAVYQGRMPRIAGAARMAMRYVLLSRTPGKAETRVRVPGLSRWRRSKPGVRGFAWKQELLNLAAGATYRVLVDFRWYDSDGEAIRSVRRRSPSCRQYSDLPNLSVRLLRVRASAVPGAFRYRVRVDNDGAVGVHGTDVRLSVDGVPAQTVTLGALAAGESRWLNLHGPGCGRWAEAAADPENAIVEVSESDNAHALACADLTRR